MLVGGVERIANARTNGDEQKHSHAALLFIRSATVFANSGERRSRKLGDVRVRDSGIWKSGRYKPNVVSSLCECWSGHSRAADPRHLQPLPVGDEVGRASCGETRCALDGVFVAVCG